MELPKFPLSSTQILELSKSLEDTVFSEFPQLKETDEFTRQRLQSLLLGMTFNHVQFWNRIYNLAFSPGPEKVDNTVTNTKIV